MTIKFFHVFSLREQLQRRRLPHALPPPANRLHVSASGQALGLSTADTWDQAVFCWGDRPVPGGCLAASWPHPTRCPPLPKLWQPQDLQMMPTSTGAQSPWLRTVTEGCPGDRVPALLRDEELAHGGLCEVSKPGNTMKGCVSPSIWPGTSSVT